MKYKAKCIDNADGFFNLTIGKIYDITTIDKRYLECIDDIGYAGEFHKTRFRRIFKNLNNIKIL